MPIIVKYPEAITIKSGEKLKTISQIRYNENGEIVKARLVYIEIEGRLKRIYGYDD